MSKSITDIKPILFLLILGLLLTSCVDDPEIESFEKAEVLTADVPDTVVTGETYSIPLSFNRPTTCHSFNEFNIEEDPDDVFVSVIIKFRDNFECDDTDVAAGQVDFEYTVDQDSNFRFRFFQRTQNNQLIYLNKDVVVESE